jgi:hypothetical protein
MQVLTDMQRRLVAPLIEACRPRGRTQHHDLRRHRADDLPTPQQRQVADHSRVAWTLVAMAQTFIRHLKLGLWERTCSTSRRPRELPLGFPIRLMGGQE